MSIGRRNAHNVKYAGSNPCFRNQFKKPYEGYGLPSPAMRVSIDRASPA